MTDSDALRFGRLKDIMAATQRLAATNDLEDAVETIRSSARRLIGADGITIILREDDECHYIEEDAIGPLWKGHSYPLESCVSGWAMLHGKTAIIPDIAQDSRVPYDLYRDTFVRSMVMAPIQADDPVGAIGAYWSEAHEPSREVVEALEAIAQATATSIANARLVSSLSRALAEAEHARDELRHRMTNSFAVTQAMARLTLPPDQARGFSERILALSRAYDIIDRRLSRERSIGLGDLLKAELGIYRNDTRDTIELAGPAVTMPSNKAVPLGFVLNELATNALKYGALSVPAGKVLVRWSLEAGSLVIEWKESGGPPVQASAIESFGSRMMRRVVEGQLGGHLTRQMRSDGVICMLDIPDMVSTPAAAMDRPAR